MNQKTDDEHAVAIAEAKNCLNTAMREAALAGIVVKASILQLDAIPATSSRQIVEVSLLRPIGTHRGEQ